MYTYNSFQFVAEMNTSTATTFIPFDTNYDSMINQPLFLHGSFHNTMS